MIDFFPMYHRVQYEGCGATFLLVCPKCNRFVKADATIKVYGDGYIKEDVPNATCSKHGRVAMPFEGYY